jgi:hypothetical protein
LWHIVKYNVFDNKREFYKRPWKDVLSK